MKKLGLLIRWWSVRGWLIGMVAIVLAVTFDVLTLADGLQIVIMYTLVLITAQYAKSTADQAGVSKKMAQETAEARFASLQPILVMGRTIAYGVIKDVRQIAEQTTIGDRTFLYNVGSGPALNLRFYLKEPNRKNPTGTSSGKELRALSPEEGYELNLKSVFGEQWLRSQDLVVEYEDVFGRKWRSGLELNHTEGQKSVTVMNLFYERLD